MAKKVAKSAKSPRKASQELFLGRWRITWMEQWDQDFVDEEVEGFFDFDTDGSGSFQFGYVQGRIDYRLLTWDGKSRMEFSWDGCDEMDPVQGRGWTIVEGDQMNGEFFFHGGDESKFKATRRSTKATGRVRRRTNR
jgi:hypothetical protein